MANDTGAGIAVLVGLGLLVAFCSGSDEASDDLDENSIELATADDSYAALDVAGASDADVDDGAVLGGETYTEFDERRDELGANGDVGGYGCTEDCGGHDAGYEWAEQNGIIDASQCGGNSWSFREGCAAYAEEQGGFDE